MNKFRYSVFLNAFGRILLEGNSKEELLNAAEVLVIEHYKKKAREAMQRIEIREEEDEDNLSSLWGDKVCL